MVIRDLTLRSAASFGSFHLIRLLYDEYVFYLVEQKVAQVLHKSPVAVMGLQQFRTSKFISRKKYNFGAKIQVDRILSFVLKKLGFFFSTEHFAVHPRWTCSFARLLNLPGWKIKVRLPSLEG